MQFNFENNEKLIKNIEIKEIYEKERDEKERN